MRYDAVFLDIDGTLLWVDVDVEGYVEDLKLYATNGHLTVERAREPLQKGLRKHIDQNINYPTEEELRAFRRENALEIAHSLSLEAPVQVLEEVMEKRISFNPYPESEEVMEELVDMGLPLYAVSNWDVELEKMLDGIGWTGYFSGIVASAKVGFEKPEEAVFEEALRISAVPHKRVVHVGNDPISDIQGAASCGIDAVLIDREGDLEALEAVAILGDLYGLPELVKG